MKRKIITTILILCIACIGGCGEIESVDKASTIEDVTEDAMILSDIEVKSQKSKELKKFKGMGYELTYNPKLWELVDDPDSDYYGDGCDAILQYKPIEGSEIFILVVDSQKEGDIDVDEVGPRWEKQSREDPGTATNIGWEAVTIDGEDGIIFKNDLVDEYGIERQYMYMFRNPTYSTCISTCIMLDSYDECIDDFLEVMDSIKLEK